MAQSEGAASARSEGSAAAVGREGPGGPTGPVLAVFTHPDDCEIACGATLARWAAAGAEVVVVVVSDGEKGSQDPAEDRRALVATRHEEARAAAAAMGAREVRFLDVVDGEVENTPALRAELVRTVREVRPARVLCPDPTAWFFGTGYYNHRDHRATGEAVLDAVSPAAGNPHFFPEQLADGLGVWKVRDVWLAPTLEPNHVEDVTGFVETKLAALACHASQLASDQLGFFREWIGREAAEAGARIGAEHGESFRVLNLED